MTEKGKWPSMEGTGTLECMNHAAAVMFHLGNILMTNDEKIRVTIDCDPETGRYAIKREVLC